MNRFWALLILIVTIILSDQLIKGSVQSTFYVGESKDIFPLFFKLSYLRNTGAMLGYFSHSSPLVKNIVFLYTPLLACVLVFILLIRSLKGPIYMSLAYSLILAGAQSNLLDRVTLGYVVDYLTFHFNGHYFPTFNIADLSISIAIIIFIIDMLWIILIAPKEAVK